MREYDTFLKGIGDRRAKNFYRYEASLAVEPIYTFLKREGAELSGLLLDVGCGSKPYRDCSPHAHYYGIDRAGKSSDVCGDLLRLPVGNEKVNLVLNAFERVYSRRELSIREKDLLGKCYYKMALEECCSAKRECLERALFYCPGHREAQRLYGAGGGKEEKIE